MRFSRLKEKLEIGADLTTPQDPNATPVQKVPRPIPATARVPRKRKAPSTSKGGKGVHVGRRQHRSRPLGGGSKIEKRQTRGKKLTLNLSDLRSDDEDEDSDLSELTSNDSDGDFCIDDADPQSQVDSGLNFDPEKESKSAAKCVKKQAPIGAIGSNANRKASTTRKNGTTRTKRTPPSQLLAKFPAKQVPPAARIPISKKKAPVKSLLPSFDQPLPSIEASSALSITSSTGSESDIDIKSLQPGTILSFGSPRGIGSLGNSAPNKGKLAQAGSTLGFPCTAARTSQFSPSEDSSGFSLQMEPEPNLLDVITPDDSVSMVNKNPCKDDLDLHHQTPKPPPPSTGE